MRKNRIPANAAVLAAAFTLAAGLSACGGSGTAAEKAETVQETEAAASEEKAADEEGQESAGEEAEKKDGAEKSGIAQPKEQKKQAPEHLELTASREYEEILNDAGGNVGGINWTTLTVADADHPELKNALEEYGKKTKERMDKAKKELREYYDEFLAGQEGYYDNCTAHMSVVPVRADDRVLSLMEFYSFYPDSHTEVHEKKGFCFDPATGKEMAVSEVLEDAEEAGAVIAEAIRKAYPDLRFDSDMEEKVKNFAASSEPAEGFGFNVGYHELRIFADDGYLTSRMGGVDVPLSFAEYPDLVKEEYREIPEDYMYWVGCGENYVLDDAGRTFSMEVLEDNPDEMYCRVQINAGDAAICSTYMYEPDGYLVHVNGKDRLYMNVPTGDVSFPTELFDLSGETIPIPGTLDTSMNYNYAGTDPAKAEFTCWDEETMDISNTVRPIGADGLPEGVTFEEPYIPDFEEVCSILEYNETSKKYLDQGMTVMDEGTVEVFGAECRAVALGTDSAEKFTAEVRFAVRNWNYIFEYDPVKDEWLQR